MVNDANHVVGKYLCSRYGCGKVSEFDTDIGAMCGEHRSPLLFPVFLHDAWKAPTYIPWAFMLPHEDQALANHGGQTLARLSERGGVSVSEALAILQGTDTIRYRHRERAANVMEFQTLLDAWKQG